jgi:PleD family two-component response regulator
MELPIRPSNHSQQKSSIGDEINSFELLTRNELRLLCVLKAEREQTVICRIAKQFPWTLEFAQNGAQALQVLQARCTQIVLFDLDLFGLDWKSDLRTLVSSPSQPSVILVSTGVSDAVWEEVIECGGYDVLRLPLQEVKTQMTVLYAWRFWANCRFHARMHQKT